MPSRRDWLRASAFGAAALLTRSLPLSALEQPHRMTIFKTPTCGCCTKWVDHARGAGFLTTVRDLDDLAEVKRSMGIPTRLYSCHTAVVGPYVVEGHVPADLVLRLLREKPEEVVGLAVPGMPVGSPGMEGWPRQRYDVLTFDRAGRTAVFATR